MLPFAKVGQNSLKVFLIRDYNYKSEVHFPCFDGHTLATLKLAGNALYCCPWGGGGLKSVRWGIMMMKASDLRGVDLDACITRITNIENKISCIIIMMLVVPWLQKWNAGIVQGLLL